MKFNETFAAMILLSATPAFAAQKDVDQVVSLDREWLLAYSQRDARPFDRIWAPDARLVSTQGRVKSKAEEREDITGPVPPQLKAAFTVSEQQARQYGETVVVIGRFAQAGTYDGQPFERPFRYTNVYVRRSGGWTLVTSQFAPIPKDAPKS